MHDIQQDNNTLLHYQEQLTETIAQINHLINKKQWDMAVEKLSSLHHADLANFLDNISNKTYQKILPMLSDIIKPETLMWHKNKYWIIHVLGVEKISQLIELLDIEDAIEVIDDINDEQKQDILDHVNIERRNQIMEGFAYPENSVGRIIEKNFVSFQEHWTVGHAIDNIKKKHIEQDFYAAIVVNDRFQPVGNILLSTLLKHNRNTYIKELMNEELKVVEVFTELDEITFIFKQYALTILSVVNKRGKLIGSISIDNMIYIIEEQTEKDIMQFGGVSTQDTFHNLLYTAKHRFPWLFINLITSFITAAIVNEFSITIVRFVAIAAMMPIITSLGGNGGMQAVTVTVRALANKDINNVNMFKIVIKETLVYTINGFLLACIASSISIAVLSNTELSLIFAIAIIINFVAAGFLGATIPILLYKLDIDPAASSGVFVTTITDALGSFSFLILAYLFL